MTKGEVKAYLASKGGMQAATIGYNNPDEKQIRAAWAEAMELMRKETGVRLKQSCSSCYRKVWEWLNK